MNEYYMWRDLVIVLTPVVCIGIFLASKQVADWIHGGDE